MRCSHRVYYVLVWLAHTGKEKSVFCNMSDQSLPKNNTETATLSLLFFFFAAARRSPWLSQNLTNQAVNSSSTLMLPCFAVGVPEPETMWYKNGVPVKEGPGNPGKIV